jgi:hypothetical protein
MPFIHFTAWNPDRTSVVFDWEETAMTAQQVAETIKPKRKAKRRAPAKNKDRKFESHLFNGVSDVLGTCHDAVTGVGERVAGIFHSIAGPAPKKTRTRKRRTRTA